MDRVRGGVFSGAMVLAGLSATLISALIAIGIRQVTHVATHPTPIYVQPASGEVAVPDATPGATRAVKRSAVAHAPQSFRPVPVLPVRHRTASTGSVSSGASVAPTTTSQQPATASQQPATSSGSGTTSSVATSPSSPPPSPSPSPSASAKGNGNGAGSANGNGSGNGNAGGNGGGNGHHP